MMKAGKEETTCLLVTAGSVKASVHVLVKGEKVESEAPESAIRGKRSCLLDGQKKVSTEKQEEIPGRWKSQRGSQQCPI